MLLVRAPLRLSFFGGATDVPDFYREHGGAVLSTAIDKFIYIAANKTPMKHIKVVGTEVEQVTRIEDLKHTLVKAALKFYCYDLRDLLGLEIASFGDIPTVGTGLGSSSTYLVALLKALSILDEKWLTSLQLAEAAAYLEIQALGSPIGRQDHYAAALGGFNAISFNPSEDGIDGFPFFTLSPKDYEPLESRLMLFWTGKSRVANDILRVQNSNVKKNTEILRKMKDQAFIASRLLPDGDLDTFGDMLNDAWEYKKQLAEGISDDWIDAAYRSARNNGALGGKILGAGGGGYLAFYVPSGRQDDVHDAMVSFGLEEIDFKFCSTGAELLYNNRK